MDQSYKRIILYGLQPGQPIDQLVMRRNMGEYQDHAPWHEFLIRLEARQASTLTLFLDQLPAEQRTPARAAGLQQARSGAAQTITGAITAMTEGMKPGNARLIAGALRDTRDIWAGYIMPDDRTRIAKLIADTPAADRETQKSLAVFAGALAAAKAPTEIKP